MKDPCFPGSWAPVLLSYFTAALSGLLAVFITAGNLLIVVAIVKDPHHRLRTPFAYFLANLAVSDLIVGVLLMPVSVMFHTMEAQREIDNTYVYIVHMTFFISLSASLFSMAAMCFDRYYTVVSISRNARRFTKGRCIAISVAIWILSIGFTGLYFLLGYISLVTIYINLSLVSIFGITLLTYVKIMRTLKRISSVINHRQRSMKNTPSFKGTETAEQRRRSGRTTQDSVGIDSSSLSVNGKESLTSEGGQSKKGNSRERADSQSRKKNIVIARERRITNVFLVMLATFLSCYIPTMAFIYILQFCLECSCDTRHIFRDIVFLVLPTGSGLNAVICILKLPYVRTAVKATFAFRKKKTSYAFGSSEFGELQRNKAPNQWYTLKNSDFFSPRVFRRNTTEKGRIFKFNGAALKLKQLVPQSRTEAGNAVTLGIETQTKQ